MQEEKQNTEMQFLTVGQMKKVCEEHKYILYRFRSGNLMGVNTSVSKIILKRKYYKDEDNTACVSYIPCSFQEYISNKRPFIYS